MCIFVHNIFLQFRNVYSGEKENEFVQFNISYMKKAVGRETNFQSGTLAEITLLLAFLM